MINTKSKENNSEEFITYSHTCGECELFGTLDCPYIAIVNTLTVFDFLPCYKFIKNN